MKLSERITFVTIPQSVGTDAKADALMKRIKEVAKLGERFDERIERFCVLVSCTSEIVFNLDGAQQPHQAIVQFHADWMGRTGFKTDDWVRFALSVPEAIINEWLRQWNAQQNLDDLDPVQLPVNRLPKELQGELKKPNSDFLGGVGTSPTTSSKESQPSGTVTRRQKAKTTKGTLARPST